MNEFTLLVKQHGVLLRFVLLVISRNSAKTLHYNRIMYTCLLQYTCIKVMCVSVCTLQKSEPVKAEEDEFRKPAARNVTPKVVVWMNK